MKHLRLVVCLSVVAFIATFTIASADSYDSEQATFQKSGAHSAKVMIGKKTATAPISFGDGASWDSVKDHYELDPSIVSGLEAGTMTISIGSDGTATFTKIKSEPKAASKPAAKK
jgi:hypothetical protein